MVPCYSIIGKPMNAQQTLYREGKDGKDAPLPILSVVEGGVQITSGNESEVIYNGVDGHTPVVTLTPIPVGDPLCPTGGTEVKINDQKFDVCNGLDGKTPNIVITGIEPGLDCLAGGTSVTINENEFKLCNGIDGHTPVVTITDIPVGDVDCPAGGSHVQIDDKEFKICNGLDSTVPGPAGTDAPLPTLTSIPIGDILYPTGGVMIASGLTSLPILNGADGKDSTIAGPAGAQGPAPTLTAIPVGDLTYPTGGVLITSNFVSLPVLNGSQGIQGIQGAGGSIDTLNYCSGPTSISLPLSGTTSSLLSSGNVLTGAVTNFQEHAMSYRLPRAGNLRNLYVSVNSEVTSAIGAGGSATLSWICTLRTSPATSPATFTDTALVTPAVSRVVNAGTTGVLTLFAQNTGTTVNVSAAGGTLITLIIRATSTNSGLNSMATTCNYTASLTFDP